MYRLNLLIVVTVLLSGCAGLEPDRVWERTSALLTAESRASEADDPRALPDLTARELEREVARLFGQPYIDPLTRYLREHADDERRSVQLGRVGAERDRRCDAVAARYRTGPLTAARLERYQAGYQFSCPAHVRDYARRLEQQPVEQPLVERTPPERSAPDEALSQQLNDCYLLTTIRNFTAALKACRQPAESGDLKAQTNMALISYALQDYASAGHWAREAAPRSGAAAYLLGEMHAAGLGVPQSHEKAEQWYTQAANQGHSAAKAALQEGSAGSPGGSLN